MSESKRVYFDPKDPYMSMHDAPFPGCEEATLFTNLEVKTPEPPWAPHTDRTMNMRCVVRPVEPFASTDGPSVEAVLFTNLEVKTLESKQVQSKHQKRKEAPVFRGFVAYFPDAIMEAARLSRIGNEQHNPGQPMHWNYGKSDDHNDCVIRHMVDFDEVDDDEVLHAIKEFWRAGANAQTLLEKRDPELHARRQAQRDRAAKGER